MEEDIKPPQPFEEVLAELFDQEFVPVHQIYRLTDMSKEEMALFVARFSVAPDAHRESIVRHMADIAEDNFVVDFGPIFVLALQDAYTPVRQAALDGLWDTTDVALYPRILDLLITDASVEVRTAAAQALSHFVMMAEWGEISAEASEPIVDALLVAYQDPESPLPLKRAALESLGPASNPRVPRLILAAYESGKHDLQLSAVFAMGTSADERWLPTVIDEMENLSEEMRAEAARAAGNIGSTEAVELLGELLHDSSDDVVLIAISSLAQIGGDEAARLLDDLAENEAYAHLHDAINEAVEEMNWIGTDLNLPLLMATYGDDDDLDDDLSSDPDLLGLV